MRITFDRPCLADVVDHSAHFRSYFRAVLSPKLTPSRCRVNGLNLQEPPTDIGYRIRFRYSRWCCPLVVRSPLAQVLPSHESIVLHLYRHKTFPGRIPLAAHLQWVDCKIPYQRPFAELAQQSYRASTLPNSKSLSFTSTLSRVV